MKTFFVSIASLALCALFSCKNIKDKVNNQKENLESVRGNQSPSFRVLTNDEKNFYQVQITKKFDSLFPSNTFNGEILIAKNGQILFEKYQGYQDFVKKTPITEETPLHVASVSKTLTSAAVLKLYDEGRLDLQDSVQKFFPHFPYHNITVEDLLSHRSGLPNYLYVMDKVWDKKRLASNEDIIHFLADNKVSATTRPNKSFQYCNTNYILLALIVEKVSGMDFPDYMHKQVFQPIGMSHSYIFSKKDSARYIPTYSVSKPYPMDPYDGSYGDKNLFTTARDLLKWDNILYTDHFLKQATIKRAFTGRSYEKPGIHNYGLGWRMINGSAGDTIIYHNGFWHGTNAVFTRFIQDTAVVIIIGNRSNANIYKGKEFGHIFSNRYADSKPIE